VLNPEAPDILYNLGMLYAELDKPEKSVKTILKCINVDPVNSNAYVALGFAYYKQSERLI
jgi:tetratricopeptide (TPR) repeat protein